MNENTEQYWEGKHKEAAANAGKQSLTSYLDEVKAAVRTKENKLLLYEQLKDLGIVGNPDDGSIRLDSLARTMRVDLVVKTQRQTAHSLQQLEEAADPLQKALNPCWELVRDEFRKEPRDWDSRWAEAANKVMFKGVCKDLTRMIAFKDSPIWHELGTGFSDSMGNPYPPFCFGSGMGWEIVSEDEIEGMEFG